MTRRSATSACICSRRADHSSTVVGEADFVNGAMIEAVGGMLPDVLYEAGLKTITDLL